MRYCHNCHKVVLVSSQILHIYFHHRSKKAECSKIFISKKLNLVESRELYILKLKLPISICKNTFNNYLKKLQLNNFFARDNTKKNLKISLGENEDCFKINQLSMAKRIIIKCSMQYFTQLYFAHNFENTVTVYNHSTYIINSIEYANSHINTLYLE